MRREGLESRYLWNQVVNVDQQWMGCCLMEV
jgi:hypothetical protein